MPSTTQRNHALDDFLENNAMQLNRELEVIGREPEEFFKSTEVSYSDTTLSDDTVEEMAVCLGCPRTKVREMISSRDSHTPRPLICEFQTVKEDLYTERGKSLLAISLGYAFTVAAHNPEIALVLAEPSTAAFSIQQAQVYCTIASGTYLTLTAILPSQDSTE